MKVIVYNGPRQMAVEERDVPRPATGEVLIRVDAAGICGSEIEGYLGQNSLRVPPLIMGHEFSGEIVELGPQTDNAPQVGQRVTVNPLISCGQCAFCRTGAAHVCPQRRLIGAHRPGAYADYVAVPTSSVIPLPDSLDQVMAALTEPFAVAIHGVALARIQPTDAVVVWGAGSIGLLTICAARLATPAHIIAVDTNPARLDSAREMGATTVLDAREGNTVETIRRLLSDVGHTVVLDAVGRSSTRLDSVAAAGPAGTVILLGLHDKETSFDVQGITRQEITLQGSYAYTHNDILRAVELLSTGLVKRGAWMELRPLDRGPESFAELVDRPGTATKIILIPETR